MAHSFSALSPSLFCDFLLSFIILQTEYRNLTKSEWWHKWKWQKKNPPPKFNLYFNTL